MYYYYNVQNSESHTGSFVSWEVRYMYVLSVCLCGGGDASYGRENSGIPYFKCLKSNVYTKILPQCSAQSCGWILTCI